MSSAALTHNGLEATSRDTRATSAATSADTARGEAEVISSSPGLKREGRAEHRASSSQKLLALQRLVGNRQVSRLIAQQTGSQKGLNAVQTSRPSASVRPTVLQRTAEDEEPSDTVSMEQLIAEADGSVNEAQAIAQGDEVAAAPVELAASEEEKSGKSSGGGGEAAGVSAAAPALPAWEEIGEGPEGGAAETSGEAPTAAKADAPKTIQSEVGGAATSNVGKVEAGTKADPEVGNTAPKPGDTTVASSEGAVSQAPSAAGHPSPLEQEEDEAKTASPTARVARVRVQRVRAPRSPKADAAFQGVVRNVRATATQQRSHATPESKAEEAAAAAQMPPDERKGRAQERQASHIQSAAASQQGRASGGAAPGFDPDAFVASVKTRIDELTPKDPKQMENIESSGVFSGAKAAVNANVTSGKKQAQGDVPAQTKAAPPTGEIPEKTSRPLEPNQAGSPPAAPVAAAGAAPKPREPEAVEAHFAKGPEQLEQRMTEAKVTEEQLEKSNEPHFRQAVSSKQEVEVHATRAPRAYRAGEKGQAEGAQGEAQAQAQSAVQGMGAARAQAMGNLDRVQQGAKSSDEQKRAELGKSIDGIYNQTKSDVEKLLAELDKEVSSIFDKGSEAAKSKAIQYIKRETEAYKRRRYNKDSDSLLSQAGGMLTQAGDWLTSMPPEYFEYFKQGRDLYVTELESVLREVATLVSKKLGEAKERIEKGKKEISDYITKQPKELQSIAKETASAALEKFNTLEENVDSKGDELVNTLAQKYVENLEALDKELEALKAEDKGVLDKAKEVLDETIGDILKAKAMLEGILAKAGGVIDKILLDPIGFLGNLLTAVKGGFEGFAANIGTHLQKGLLSWLTGTLSAAGLQLPAQLDLPGIFSLVMQVLGLTWTNIRAQLVKGLGPQGEQVMSALETSWEVLQKIQSGGLAGLWEAVKELVGDLKSQVLDSIKQIVIEQVVQAGIKWVVGMLGGPAGAFMKAVDAIVKVVSWVMNNAGRLAGLVSSVVDSAAAIAGGDTATASKGIENALGQALPVAIGFLASLIGLGDLPKKIQGVIQKVQAPINKAIQWLIGKAKLLAKSVLGKLKGAFNKDKKSPSKEAEPLSGDKATRWKAGIAALRGLDAQDNKEIKASLAGIKKTYGFDTLSSKRKGKDWSVKAVMRQTDEVKVEGEGDDELEKLQTARKGASEAVIAAEKVTKEKSSSLKELSVSANQLMSKLKVEHTKEEREVSAEGAEALKELAALYRERFEALRARAVELQQQVEKAVGGLPMLIGARGEAASAMKGVQKLLGQEDTRKRLGEQAESYEMEAAKLESELKTIHEQLQQDDALTQMTRRQEAYKALELQAKELKKRIQESMASTKTEEDNVRLIAGRRFRRTNEMSKSQKVYKEEGKNFFIVEDIDSHNGGAWKGASSSYNLRSKATRMGTYDQNLNRIGD